MTPDRDEVLRLIEAGPRDESRLAAPEECAALVALGGAAVPGLIAALDGPPGLAIGVQRTLAAIGAPAVGPLVASLDGTTRVSTARIVRALSQVVDASPEAAAAARAAVPALIALMRSCGQEPDPRDAQGTDGPMWVRAAVARALGEIGDVAAVPVLIEALAHPHHLAVRAACALGRLGSADAVAALVAVLRDGAKYWVPRGAAAAALGDLGRIAEPALPALREALAYPVTPVTWDDQARESVADAIERIEAGGPPHAQRGMRYDLA